jgi:hypothetical protein
MNLLKSGEINILEIQKRSDLPTNMNGPLFDLIISNEEIEGFQMYPTHVVFRIPIEVPFDEFINTMKSSDRSSIRRRVKVIESKYKIEIEDPINENSFALWYEGYKSFIENKIYGENRVKDDWFKEKSFNNMLVKVYINNENNGGTVVTKYKKALGISFAWYSNLAKKDGITTYIIKTLYDYCLNKELKYLTFGKDGNLFGGRLSVEHYNFKAFWTNKVFPAVRSEMKFVYINKNTTKSFIYYTMINNQLVINKVNL